MVAAGKGSPSARRAGFRATSGAAGVWLVVFGVVGVTAGCIVGVRVAVDCIVGVSVVVGCIVNVGVAVGGACTTILRANTAPSGKSSP
jgi:hypothetical protein